MSTAPLASYPQRQFTPPAGAVDLLVVRHGASAPYVPGEPVDSLDGQDDPPLAPEGQRQAQLLADRLAPLDIDRLFVTSLRRTHETAAPLAARTGLTPEPVADLREVGLGEWEQGRYRVAFQERTDVAVRIYSEQRWDIIPGAERDEDFHARVARGMDTVLAGCAPDSRAVVVVHGGVIASICHAVTGSRPFSFLGADNASITRVVVLESGTRLLRGYNDTAHLA